MTESQTFVSQELKNKSTDQYSDLNVELEHLRKRCSELSAENTELRQKTQVVVKKVETNVVSMQPGIDEEAAKKISDLEAKLFQADVEAGQNVTEIQELKEKLCQFHEIEARLVHSETENAKFNNLLTVHTYQYETLQRENNELKELKAERDREYDELCRKLRDTELLTESLEFSKRQVETLTEEIQRVTSVSKINEQELHNANQKIALLESQKCVSPQDHENILLKTQENEAFILELNELKEKYVSLKEEYDKTTDIMKLKDEEILNLTNKLEALQKDCSAVLDREFQLEERLNNEVEALTRKVEEKTLEVTRLREKPNERLEELTEDLFKLNELINERDNTIIKLEKDMKQLVAEFEKEKARLISEYDEQKSTYISEFEKEKQTIISDYEKEKNTLIADYDKEKGDFMSDFEKEKESLVSEFEKERSDLKAEIEKLNKLGMTQLEIIEGKALEVSKLSEELAKMNKELTEYKESFKILENDRDAFIAERDTLADRVKSLLESIVTLQEELDFTKSNFGQIEARCELLDNDVATYKSQLSQLQEENRNLWFKSNELEALRSELLENSKLLENANIDKDNLLSELSELRESYNALDSLRPELAEAQRKVGYLALEREKLINTLEERGVEMRNLSDMVANHEALKLKFDESIREIEALKDQLMIKEGIVRDFNDNLAKLRELEQTLEQISSENGRLLSENKMLSSKCIKLEQDVVVTTEKYNSLNVLYDKIKVATENISKVHDKLAKACDETEKVKTTEETEKQIFHTHSHVFEQVPQKF